MSLRLSHNEFLDIVKNTPLISIDLIVEDFDGRILTGQRKNSPAKGFWFVPGGRILKDETIFEAFLRMSREELNKEISILNAQFLGVYEHLYSGENFANIEGVNTHYIVLAFKCRINATDLVLPEGQHKDYAWLLPEEILKSKETHQNTKNYFLNPQENNFLKVI